MISRHCNTSFRKTTSLNFYIKFWTCTLMLLDDFYIKESLSSFIRLDDWWAENAKKANQNFFQRFSNSWFSEASGLNFSIILFIENFTTKMSLFVIILFCVVEKSLHSFCAILTESFVVLLVILVYKCHLNWVQYYKEVVIRCVDRSHWGGVSKSVREPQGRKNKQLYQKLTVSCFV